MLGSARSSLLLAALFDPPRRMGGLFFLAYPGRLGYPSAMGPLEKRTVEVKVRLTPSEAEAVKRYLGGDSKLSDFFRVAGLQSAGLDAPDPYASHRSRLRDESGKIIPQAPWPKWDV